jgi:hypothetical protein
MKLSIRNLFLVAALFFSATWICSAQVDTTVGTPTASKNSALIEIPTASADSSGDPNSASSLTMGGEYKQPKNVVEQEKPVFWTWSADIGYESEYNFRGTNLTPDADGAGFIDAEVSKWNFTLGIYGIHQFGTARATTWSMGESGGGGTFNVSIPNFQNIVELVPKTTQTRFNELDLYLQYHLALGPVDLTVGNIAFFIQRDAETVLHAFLFGQPFVQITQPSVGNEQFDRIFVRLSTSKIPYVTPSITYYQTIYNDGQDARALGNLFGPFERNDNLGGYLDGRLRGNFPVTRWLTINPYGVISVSFRDRVEPIENPQSLRDAVRGRSLSGFNVAQAGLELPIHLLHTVGNSDGPYAPPDLDLYFVPFGWYSYHISDPTPGTDRNEWWGGAKFTVTF